MQIVRCHSITRFGLAKFDSVQQRRKLRHTLSFYRGAFLCSNVGSDSTLWLIREHKSVIAGFDGVETGNCRNH